MPISGTRSCMASGSSVSCTTYTSTSTSWALTSINTALLCLEGTIRLTHGLESALGWKAKATGTPHLFSLSAGCSPVSAQSYFIYSIQFSTCLWPPLLHYDSLGIFKNNFLLVIDVFDSLNYFEGNSFFRYWSSFITLRIYFTFEIFYRSFYTKHESIKGRDLGLVQ